MKRQRDRHGFRPEVPGLEPRELLSRPGVHEVPAATGGVAAIHPYDALGPGGASTGFINLSTYRRTVATSVVHRLNEAFQAFAYHVLHQPVTVTGIATKFGGSTSGNSANGGSTTGGNGGTTGAGGQQVSGVPIGTVPNPPTLANFLIQLDVQSSQALATIEVDTNRPQPSIVKGPKVTARAQDALIPYATGQIIGLGSALVTSPPRFNADGTLATPGSLNAVNAAFNAIVNSVAEYAVHPELFRSPGDFYNNPQAHYTITFDGDPVAAAPYYYLLGPGGVPLRGR